MYNKNYFPTPNEVIKTMLAPYGDEIKTATILEPSAGMGAICDYLCWNGAKKTKVFTCEVDDNMQATLKGKGYKVLQGDFLSYSGAMNFDFIIGNPPFDRGADHLLKAWEILRNGKIVFLLNEETILNPYTESRQHLVSLIEKFGSVEYLGSAFESADRKTNVGVALVRLEKVSEQSKTVFSAKASEGVEEIDLTSTAAGVEKSNIVNALCRSYKLAIDSTANLYKAMKEFQLYSGAFIDEYACSKMCNSFFESSQKFGYTEAHNEFTIAFQKRAWDAIFRKTRVSGLMTKKVAEKFDKWREEMGGVDLNEENIMMIFDALIQQRVAISDECIVEAFDAITYHAVKNRNARGETWKTNSAFMVPEKFILDYIVESGWSGGLSFSYTAREKLNDIDRALCMVSGKVFESSDPEAPGIKKISDSISDWCKDKTKPEESEFFSFKCYQKGSCHFKFKDDALRMEFNRRACLKKGWRLPEEEKFRGKNRR